MIYEEWISYRQVVSTIRRIIYKMIKLHNYRIKNTTFYCIWYVLCETNDNFNKNVVYRMITFHNYHVFITFKSMGVVLPLINNSHHNQMLYIQNDSITIT